MGKRFDFEAIKNRMITGLRKKTNWAIILNNGTVGNLIDVIAEGRAEDARYMEYLLGEKKWKTAMNMSSLLAQTDLISYKRQLPTSAIGYVVVSHTDDEGKDRLKYFGNYFFDLDAPSDYDDIEKKENSTEEEKRALVPWTYNKQYVIPKGTRFIAANGTEYFSTEYVSSRSLKKPFSKMTEIDLLDFYEKGCWNGIKYLKIPVMQGIQKVINIGSSNKSERFQTLILDGTNYDGGTNEISSKFFYITVKSGNEEIFFSEIPKLSMASPVDNVFEKSILKSERGIKIKFGDGLSGAIPPDGEVLVHCVETLGSNGNLPEKYQLTTMVFPSGEAMIDPRDNSNSTFLSCTNTAPILGGRDLEDIDNLKFNAPGSYLNSYTTATNKNYLNFIKKMSPLNLLHVKIYSSEGLYNKPLSDINIGKTNKNTVSDEISISTDFINITALLSNGEKIEDPQSQFIEPLELSLNDQKGPSDVFNFIQPNLIELTPSVVIMSNNFEYTKEEIFNYTSEALCQKYDIFNQEFNEPIYYSNMLSEIQKFKFCDSVELYLEAVANIDYDKTSSYIHNIEKEKNKELDLIKIPFSFDKLYNSDLLLKGFKDCRKNSDYLLKVDFQFKNSPENNYKNRTFFLYDDREDESGKTSVNKAKWLDKNSKSSESIQSKDEDYFYIERQDNSYKNKQVRVAQFDFIENITDTTFMRQAKDFSKAPTENRAFEITKDGTYYIDPSISEETEGYEQIENAFYKINNKFIDGLDISFNENLLSGAIYIPKDYLNKSLNINKPKDIINFLKQFVDIRVYAQPNMSNFLPEDQNDIIYINRDYIKVEKTKTN